QRQWFGVLVCESEQPDAFDEQYIRFVFALTSQIAVAVENRMLFNEAQMEAQRALALAEVGQLATRIGVEFERNLTEVFARVAAPANYDRWMLALISEENPDRLERITWRSPNASEDTQRVYFDLETAEHSIADSVRQEQTLLVNDPAHYPAFV